MTWNDAEHELWTLHPDGSLHITDGDGFFSRLTLNVDSMYYDGKSALAVMPDGSVLNICASVPTEQTVKYISHPIMLSADMQQRPARIIWNVFGSNLHLRLTVQGEQGEGKWLASPSARQKWTARSTPPSPCPSFRPMYAP